MLEKVNNSLMLSPLTEKDKARGILGRLCGPIASCVVPTRNGRQYTDELWEKAFNSPLVKEMFENGGLPGELNHPEDRCETDASKIAIMMPNPPKKDNKGQLVATLDILDTPCGKIAYQLAKYGFRFGISSRGEGDVTEDLDGNEIVDPDAYSLNAFDLVLLPACKNARLQFTESLNTKKPLKEALNETINSASEDDQKIMTEALNQMKIDYKSEAEKKISDSVSNIVAQPEESIAADNTGAQILNELQEALKKQQDLENQVKVLQEKLSVCYTKEARYVDAISRVKSDLVGSKNEVKILTTKVQELNEMLKVEKTKSETSDNNLKLVESKLNQLTSHSTTLTEGIASKNNELKSLNEEMQSMKLKYEKNTKQLEEKAASLTESLNEVEKDMKIIRTQASTKLASAQQLVEKYKKIAKTAVDKYISSQAIKIGVDINEIKSRLKESYSFNDIDAVCESLQSYKLAANSLPFNIKKDSSPKLRIKESTKEVINIGYDDHLVDDDVNDSFFNNI